MLLRFLFAVTVAGRRRPRLELDAVSRIQHRVLPVDIDVLGHMNNGRYLSFCDLGRIDLTRRTGLADRLTAAGIHAVVGQQSITYRRSIGFLQRFTLESRLVGVDDRSCFVEQRFVVGGQLMARAIVRGRFIERGVGAIRMTRVNEVLGVDLAERFPVPDDVAAWSDWSALPPAKADVPSLWP